MNLRYGKPNSDIETIAAAEPDLAAVANRKIPTIMIAETPDKILKAIAMPSINDISLWV